MTTACVVDNGPAIELTIALQKHFDRVLYTSPWQCKMPTSNQTINGYGLVDRIESIFDHLDEIDTFVFPHLYQAPLQRHLEKMGFDVWGPRMGEELEINRVWAKQLMKRLGIAIGPYEVVTGTVDLRKYLKAHDDRYVKVSKTRGDFETFHSENFGLAEQWIDDLEFRLGPKKTFMEFICEEPITPAVETGFDGYCIDGQFSDPILGVEIKDTAYVGKVSPLPKEVKDINDRLAPFFKEVHFRSFFSTEVRVKDGTGYMLDPTCRMPWPPGELYTIWIDNLGEIVEQGAKGKLVKPKFTGTWGAVLMVESQWSKDKWQAIEVPKDLKDNVKFYSVARIDGKNYAVPGDDVPVAIVAVAETAEFAIEQCKDIAKEIKGYTLHEDLNGLDMALEELEKLKIPSEKPKEAPRTDTLADALSNTIKGKSLSDALSEALG